MAFLALCIFVLVCLVGRMFVDHDYGTSYKDQGTDEDDMSPVVGLLMYDDFMDNGELDDF